MREPEYASLEAFISFLNDDERNTFTPGEAHKVAANSRARVADLIEKLKKAGFTPAVKAEAKDVRGVNSNPHDRFTAKNGWVSGTGIGNASRHMVQAYQPK